MHVEELDRMVGLMECQKEVQEWLLEEHIHANENNHLAREVHECTMSALHSHLQRFVTVEESLLFMGVCQM